MKVLFYEYGGIKNTETTRELSITQAHTIQARTGAIGSDHNLIVVKSGSGEHICPVEESRSPEEAEGLIKNHAEEEVVPVFNLQATAEESQEIMADLEELARQKMTEREREMAERRQQQPDIGEMVFDAVFGEGSQG